MKLRNHRLLLQGSPTEFHNKQAVELNYNALEINLLLQTSPSPTVNPKERYLVYLRNSPP